MDLSIAIPLAGLASNAGLQLVLARLPLPIGPLRRQFASFAAGLVVAAILLARAPAPAGSWALCLGSYTFLSFIFFNAINLNLSSIRMRFLREHLRVHPAPLPEAELAARYPAAAMLDVRLARLAAGGQIRQRGGRYYYRPGLVAAIACLFSGLRRLLGFA